MKKLKLSIITPSETLIDDIEIFSVNIKTLAGEMTILKDHVPVLTSLIAGTLHYSQNGTDFKYVTVDSGLVQINKDTVSIVANEARFVKK